MKMILKTVTILLAIGCIISTPGSAAAAGTATFSLQLSGNAINVYETSTVAVNTVEADFNYVDNQNALQTVAVTTGSTFSTCVSSTSASIVCSALGGNVTGTHLVAVLSITLKSETTSAIISAAMQDSSAIYASSDNSDTLNHSALPSAAYSYTAPAPAPNPMPTPAPAAAPNSKPADKNRPAAPSQTNTPASNNSGTAPNQGNTQKIASSQHPATLAASTTASRTAIDTYNVGRLFVLICGLAAIAVATYYTGQWLMTHRIHISVTSMSPQPIVASKRARSGKKA